MIGFTGLTERVGRTLCGRRKRQALEETQCLQPVEAEPTAGPMPAASDESGIQFVHENRRRVVFSQSIG